MQVLKVGQALVHLRERRVFVDGAEQRLGGRAFDLLLALMQQPDRVVERDELYRQVWADTAVEPNNLAVQILALRRLLGANSVLTVPRRGYRLMVPVRPLRTLPAAHGLGSNDAAALRALAHWLAESLERERWLTLAGATPPARESLARLVYSLRVAGGPRVVWQLNEMTGPQSDAAQHRLVRIGAQLVVNDADDAARLKLASWLNGVPAGSALRVLALAQTAPEAMAGERVIALPDLHFVQAVAAASTSGPAPALHPLRKSSRSALTAKAK